MWSRSAYVSAACRSSNSSRHRSQVHRAARGVGDADAYAVLPRLLAIRGHERPDDQPDREPDNTVVPSASTGLKRFGCAGITGPRSGPRHPQERRTPHACKVSLSTATGIRTPVSAVRGRRPSPLDDGGSSAGDCSGGLGDSFGGGGMLAPVHRPVVEGSPVRSRRGPATVNGRRCVADATGVPTALREGAALSPKPGDLAPVVRHTTLEEKGGHMTNRIRGALPVALAIAAVGAAAPTAAAAPVSVNLRVEGVTSTIFDGPVTTDGHPITTAADAAAPQLCNGTNAGAFPSPVPTATPRSTTAPGWAASPGTATWDITFSDFSVTRIGRTTPPPTPSSGPCGATGSSPDFGGCSHRVNHGDDILWVFDAFSKSHVAPARPAPPPRPPAQAVHRPVVDGQDGIARRRRDRRRRHHRRRRPRDAQRSPTRASTSSRPTAPTRSARTRSSLCVDPPGADPCTSSGQGRARPSPPSLPGRRLASEPARSRTVLISWQASDADGAGVAYYAVDVREVSDGAKASAAADDWRSIEDHTVLTRRPLPRRLRQRLRVPHHRRRPRRQPDLDRDRPAGAARRRPRPRPLEAVDAAGSGSAQPRPGAARSCAPTQARRDRQAALHRPLGLADRTQARQRRPPAGDARRQVAHAAPARPLGAAHGALDQPAAARRLAPLRIRSLGGGPVELDAVAPRP